MIEYDTVRLLRECDAGIKMGISSIEDVMNYTANNDLKHCLTNCKTQHEELKTEIQELLDRYKDDGKEPNAVSKAMSWIKTNAKLAVDNSDKTIANVITDGCNMGVKYISQYLNQYKAADEKSKDIAKSLISSEEKLVQDMRNFL